MLGTHSWLETKENSPFLDFLLVRHFHGRTSLYKKFFLLLLTFKSSILVFLFKLPCWYTPLLAGVGFNKFESLWERPFVAAKDVWEGSECAISHIACRAKIKKTHNYDVIFEGGVVTCLLRDKKFWRVL